MKQTNCPNCGAPYDLELTKCPYCGTNYFDLSFIDFDVTEPFYIKIKRTFKDQNKFYNILKWICLVFLPTVGILLSI